uniref:Uncharacterized protein n=1 Tax=Anguilla anguilla TaxID=7936 RepID=A0A0E9VZZ6_ANGAN
MNLKPLKPLSKQEVERPTGSAALWGKTDHLLPHRPQECHRLTARPLGN